MTVLAKLEKTNKTDLLEVIWHDIVMWGGWTKIEDDKTPPSVCYSYGFPIAIKDFYGKKALVLSATSSGTNGSSEYNQHATIPIDCIHSFRKVKLK